MDNVLRVNLVNFITVGLMAYIFVFIINAVMKKYIPAASIGGKNSNVAPAAPSDSANRAPLPTVAYSG